MARVLTVCSVVLALVFLAACGSLQQRQPLKKYEFARAAMGTQFRIVLYANDAGKARSAADSAFDRIDRLDDELSDYQADSELSLLPGHPVNTPVPVSRDLFNVLWDAQKVSTATRGTFDVTVGPFTRLWRFSRKRHVLPSEVELADARKSFGFEHLLLDPSKRTVTLTVPGMRLDVGGIAKGFAADEALAKLASLGIKRALVAASGDIAVGDAPPGRKGWTVSISRPGSPDTDQLQTLLLHNAAVSTSGDTEQFIEINGTRYSHILDPRTGLGLTNHCQATVVAPRGTWSDPLATAVRILGAHDGAAALKHFPGTAALVVEFDSARTNVVKTPGFSRWSTH